MIKKLISLIVYLLAPVWQYFKIMNFNKVLNIKKIDSTGVYLYDLPEEYSKLHVFKLITNNDIFQPIDFDNLKRRLQDTDRSQIFYFLIKQEGYEMGYIATFCSRTASEFKDSMKLKPCNNIETLEFILDIYNINKYSNDKKHLTIKPSINIDSIESEDIFDPLFYNFRKILTDGAYIQNKQYKLYQVVKTTNKTVIPQKETIAKDFNGIFFSYIDLSKKRLTAQINDNLAYSRRTHRTLTPYFRELADAETRGEGNLVVANMMFFVEDTSYATDMASKFGFEITEKDGLDKLYIQKKSPLLTRELDYDLLIPTENLSKIFGVRTKKNITVNDLKNAEKAWTQMSVDFYGYNIYGSFVNFCFRLNQNPHACLIADSGSGKSVAVQKMLSLIYRIDFEKQKVDRWNQVKTRYFEVGGSSGKLQKFFKGIYGDDVGLIEGDFDSMNFSFCDVQMETDEKGFRKISKDSKTIAVQLLNVALKEYDIDPLNAGEQTLYEAALEEVYANNAYKGLTIRDLEHISKYSYGDKIALFRKKGYRDDTWLHEIEDCGNIDNLTKPMLRDIINRLELNSGSSYLNSQEKLEFESTIKKLNAIEGVENKLYGALNSLVFDDKTFYAIEFNKIKQNTRILKTLFVFIMVQIYNKDVETQIKLLREGKKMKQIVYIFEELRNFFEGNPEIEKLAKTIVFEGRKFQIGGIFIGQKPDHFPQSILKGCASIFFLNAPSIEKKQELKSYLMTAYKNLPSVEYLIDNLENHTLGIVSDLGTFSCKLEVTDKEAEMFSI